MDQVLHTNKKPALVHCTRLASRFLASPDFIVSLLFPLVAMSLAFAMFGARRSPTEEAHHTFPHVPMEWTMVRPTPFDDACAEPHEQNYTALHVPAAPASPDLCPPPPLDLSAPCPASISPPQVESARG